jgi:hypothetical protein
MVLPVQGFFHGIPPLVEYAVIIAYSGKKCKGPRCLKINPAEKGPVSQNQNPASNQTAWACSAS